MLTRASLLLALVSVAACQPMYVTKTEKLKPVPHKTRPTETGGSKQEVKYALECEFTRSPAPHTPDFVAAQKKREQGDVAIDKGNEARKKTKKEEAFEGYRDAIDRYSAALRADNFDAQATLQLARAYDALYRKGCALKMLERLQVLTKNPKKSPHALEAVQELADNTHWFEGYRPEAIAAAGL